MSPIQQPLRLNRFWLLLLIGLSLALQLAVNASLRTNLLGERWLTALLDPVAHAALALMVVLPWLVGLRLPGSYLLLAIAAAIFIDLDHFVAAGSFSVKEAISLPGRPVSHSLLFSAVLAGIIGLIARQAKGAGVVFLALLTHLSRDATSGGTPWLFPLSNSPRLTAEFHLGFWLVIALAGVLGAKLKND